MGFDIASEIRCSPSQRYKFLKAIHNSKLSRCRWFLDVRRHKDTNFWKQFTTIWFCCFRNHWMFAVTKIQIFESNSQPNVDLSYPCRWCSPSQRYKFLKAIHNGGGWWHSHLFDVRRHKDTNFWKQFTTCFIVLFERPLMFAVTKIQIFESNSQLNVMNIWLSLWCSPSQRYKFLKAIHNRWIRIVMLKVDVRRHKDTNFWKQFTTEYILFFHLYRCSPSQRYKFLKAIHNQSLFAVLAVNDVRRHKDTNFWKQFTTHHQSLSYYS